MPLSADSRLHVAQIVSRTEAEGPGRRLAVWFQGCPLRCPGCCNPEMLPFVGGEEILAETIVTQMQSARDQERIIPDTFFSIFRPF